MYEAAPERPKKTSISRSRAGCDACRRKRRKCDEVKPVCGRCGKSGEPCIYPSHRFEFHDASSWAAHKSQVARSRSSTHPRQSGSHDACAYGVATPATSVSSDAATPQFIPNQDAHSTHSKPRGSSIASGGSVDESDSPTTLCFELSHIGKSITPIHSPNSPHLRYPTAFSSIPPRIVSPRESNVDGRYMAHFISHVIDMVPFNLKVICNNMNATRAVEFAAMALSAANLANLKGGYVTSPSKPGGSKWAPERGHMKDALRYTKMALSTAIEHVSPRVNEAIAAHLLLLFVEAEVGTFKGLRRHLGSISKLTLSNDHHLSENLFESDLIEAIADSNVMLRYVAGLWNHTSVRTESSYTLSSLSHRALSNGATINLIVSTALVSSMRAVILRTVQNHLETRPGTPLTTLVDRHWQHYFIRDNGNGSGSEQEIDMTKQYEQCLDEIRTQYKRLRECKSPLLHAISQGTPPSTPGSNVTFESSALDDEPLRFKTHEEAMEAAEYAFAHIVCDETLLSGLLDRRPQNNPPNRWLRLLLRITKGLNPSKCVSKNKYRRGIIGMILQAVLRCESPGPLTHLNSIVKQMIATGGGWEDFSTPLTHTLLVVESIQQQFHLGRKIILVASRDITLDCDIFSSSSSSMLMIHGREADGSVFDDEIIIDVSAKNQGSTP